MTTSNAMQRRIAAHLAAGETPSVRGNRVVLKDVVLVRATGDRTPAAAEAERQATALGVNLNMAFWDTSRATTYTSTNRITAYDRSGTGHTVSRRTTRDGDRQQVVTRAGRRFYEQAPQTEWMINIPVIYRRTYPGEEGQPPRRPPSYFNPHTIVMTEYMMDTLFDRNSREYSLIQHTRTRDGVEHAQQAEQMMAAWNELFPPEKEFPTAGNTMKTTRMLIWWSMPDLYRTA